MTPREREIVAAVQEHGSTRKAAVALGIHHGTIDHAMRRIRRKDPAWQAAAEAHGFDPKHGGWWKQPPVDDKPGVSVFIRREDDAQSAAEALRAAFDAYEPVAPTAPPRLSDDDLMNVVKLPDVHMGMHAWSRETGADYSTKIAATVVRDALGALVPRLPPAGHGVLIALGDFYHQNDATNMTPRSRHILDVDGRFLKVMEAGAFAMIAAIDLMLDHHAQVEVVILPGNHDPQMAQMLALALRLRYEREPRVTVHDGAGLWWVREHGQVMLAATHLHAIKFEAVPGYIAAEWPESWGRTRHRYAFTGHEHRERTRDFPGVNVETLRPITARDAYAAGAYHSTREVSAMTFHRNRGRVSRIYEAIQ